MTNAANTGRWKEVGERVGALIRLRGYKSVELFAHEHEIDKSVLNRLIRGRREVRLSTFLKILEALEVSNLYDLLPAGLTVKDPGEAKARRGAEPPKVFRFLRGEFDRIEVRKTARDKKPLVLEGGRKPSSALTVTVNGVKIEV
jgi:DNA-binding Xre family transcriptional regulator